MKILRLEFQNIHSLKGHNIIDFTIPPLSETGIFAIVGATGSGKSTLLDVIMLALYGQIPRMSKKISVEEVEKTGTVLTRGTENAYAQVEFLSKGREYRSKWYLHKKRKNFDYSMELSELPDGKILEEKKSEVPKANEKIIGLNYEQFQKSIVLAQGNFAKFLKANPEERTQMLEKITGAEIYRTIGRRAFETTKEYRHNFEEQQNILLTYKILSAEQRNEINKKIAEIQQKTNKIAENIVVYREKILLKENIHQIKKEIKKYSINLENIEKNITNFDFQLQKLHLHEKLIVYKTDIFAINELMKKFEHVSEKLNRNKTMKIKLLEELKKLDEKIGENDILLQKSKQKLESAQIFIKKAQKISEQIALEHQNSNHKQNIFDKLNVELKNISKEFLSNKEKLTQVLNEKNEIEKWFISNTELKTLKTNYVIIEKYFNDYSLIKEELIKSVNKSSIVSHFKDKKLGNYNKILLEISGDINAKILALEIKDSKADLFLLKDEYDKKISEFQVLEKQIYISENYVKLLEKNNNIKKQIKHKADENLRIENRRIKTIHEREILEIKIKELELKLNREQLEKKYESDRLHLQDNRPCPLCGATNHPFKKQKVNVDVRRTQKTLTSQIEYKQKIDEEINQLNITISTLKNTNENLEQQIAENLKTAGVLSQQFAEMNKKTAHNFAISELIELQEYYKKILDDKNQLSQRISELEKYKMYENYLSECSFLQEKTERLFSINKQTKLKLAEYEKYYDAGNSPAEILKKLGDFSNLFDKKSLRLTEITTKTGEISALLAEKEKHHKQIEKNLAVSKDELRTVNLALQSLQRTYKSIITENFNNQSPENFHRTSTAKIQELSTNIANQKNNRTQLSTKLEAINNQIIDLLKEYETTEKKLTEQRTALFNKLSELKINSIDQINDKILTETTVKHIKTTFQELNDSKVSVNQLIVNNKETLSKFVEKDDNISIEILHKNLETAENEHNSLNRTFGGLKNQLQNDYEQLQKRTEVEKKVHIAKKNYERWEKLNSIIGDATGKNFAAIAQQFTLTKLLKIANKHLEKFSDRYVLDPLGNIKENLFVYDTYMGLNKRSTQTLSGGETFLVSLSLALALSDLASRKTKIESLFIDEGFGSLDQLSLDKALVNLEKLHRNSNRTIGIISHVAHIKERINNQIMITKNNSGHSKISII